MVSAVLRNLNDSLIKKMPGAQGIDPHVVPLQEAVLSIVES